MKRKGFIEKALIYLLVTAMVFGGGLPVIAAEEPAKTSSDPGIPNIYTGKIFANDFTSKPSSYGGRNTIVSPRSIELRYQSDPANNGKMYLTFESGDVPDNGKTAFPIYESVNGGETWTANPIGYVKDTNNGWGNDNCPMLFELPAQLGDLPAGTIICGGIATTTRYTETSLDVYYSTDLGRNWTYLSTIGTGGGNNTGQDPLWEPFFLYDDVTEQLVCYYSDETDPKHSQKLVLKTTSDGKNWGELVEVAAFNDPNQRPGMAVVTQMENGYYMMVLELYGQSGVPNSFKFSQSKDPTDWNAADLGAEFGASGSPYVTTLNDGTLMLNVFSSRNLYYNTRKDGLGAWRSVSSPVQAGYNRQLYQLSTGEVFVNSTPIHGTWPKNVWYGTLAPPSVNDVDDDTSVINTLTVTTTEDGGSGTVSRMGEIRVNSTTPYWLEAIPDEGSEVKDIKVNGVSIGKNAIFRVTMETDKNVEVIFGDPADVDRNTVYLINRRYTNQHVVVPQGYTSPDVTVIGWDRGSETKPEYEWYIRQVDGTDTYRIENLKSGLVLGIKSGSTSNQAVVDQQAPLSSNNEHQLWQIIPENGGYYRFKNVKSGMMLACSSSSGGNIQQRTEDTTGTGDTFNQQCWSAVKVYNDPPKITVKSLPDGKAGEAYSAALASYGNVPVIAPVTWAIDEGVLPDGLSLNGDTGVISGTPTKGETSSFTVKAVNAAGSDTAELSITIEPDFYADLQALIAEAEELDEYDYTADTWAELQSALSAAKDITAEDDTEDIQAAYTALRNAIDSLEGYVAVTSVKIDGAAIQQVRMRNTKQFTATVNPTGATDPSLTWESSNEKIFTVDDNGLVTGLGTGSAKLIVTSGGKTSFIMVQVTA